jgi:hypothetical protein
MTPNLIVVIKMTPNLIVAIKMPPNLIVVITFSIGQSFGEGANASRIIRVIHSPCEEQKNH